MTGEAVPPAGDPPGPSRQLIDELLRAAVAAPSLHNAQPWRFHIRLSSSVIELAIDPARMLPSADPHGRAAHIACGAALFNLRVAAAAAGLQPDIRLLPDPGQPLLLAEIRLTGRHQATSWERELRAAIPRRQTNRKPFSNRVVPPGIRAELGEAASLEGATLHFLDHGEAVRVLGLAADAERDMLADPAYRAELARWVGDQPDRGGIPESALGPRSLEGGAPVRDFIPEEHPGPAGYAWFEEDPQLAVLSVHFGGARLAGRRAGPAAGLVDRHQPRDLHVPAHPAAGNRRCVAGPRSAVRDGATADDPADRLWVAYTSGSAPPSGDRCRRMAGDRRGSALKPGPRCSPGHRHNVAQAVGSTRET
jgi:hypothetical protein